MSETTRQGPPETRTVEAPWSTYIRVCRYVPERDEVDFSERAPRERAPSGLALYTVPAAEGTAIAEVRAGDLRQDHVIYYVWLTDDWYEHDTADLADHLDPAGRERRRLGRIEWEAYKAAFRDARQYREHRHNTDRHGIPLGATGLHRDITGGIIWVYGATPKQLRYRRARPEEIAEFNARSASANPAPAA